MTDSRRLSWSEPQQRTLPEPSAVEFATTSDAREPTTTDRLDARKFAPAVRTFITVARSPAMDRERERMTARLARNSEIGAGELPFATVW